MGIAATVLFVALRLTNFYGDPNPWTTKAELIQTIAGSGGVSNMNGGEAMIATNRIAGIKLSEPAFSVLSFLNTTKYPPSLLFLLMTLGPSLIVLALADGISGRAIWQNIAITFGRVPMFFYILQWFVAHGMGIVLSLIAGKSISYFFMNFGENGQAAPPDYGFSLWIVHAAWIAGLVILYPLCRWYGNYKRRNKHWVLSYL